MAPRPVPLSAASRQTRRHFLGDFGKRSLAIAVLSPAVLAACGSDSSSSDGSASGNSESGSTTEPTSSTTTAATDDSGESEAPANEETGETGDGAATQELRWARAELDFVSAYVLARGNSAAIIDTGVSGSADAIGQSLADLGLNYSNVDHVVLTHHHGDHAGSIAAVMEQAVNATVYAGEADLDSISFDTITGLVGGEDIFGFEALATPGHTAGHMAVIDHEVGLLVAGDAIFTNGGAAAEGPERFFDDVELSRDSIREMAALSFNTLLVGHGDPIEGGADAVVAELADSL